MGPSNFAKIKSLAKAIEASRRANINVDLKRNNTVQFVITGGENGVSNALDDVKYEFEKVKN